MYSVAAANYTMYRGRQHVKKERSIPRRQGNAEGLTIQKYISSQNACVIPWHKHREP